MRAAHHPAETGSSARRRSQFATLPDKVDVWGKRRLAYDIKKKSEGFYAVVDMTTTPEIAQELDRQLGLNEAVLRTKLLRPEA